jgi:3-hydroxyisobutyrate dehydrogenase-like beta-hydroxyacid dehydrogenase
MGAALAEAAAQRGNQVTVWNRTRKKAEALRVFGIAVAESPRAAVLQSERAHLVLSNDAAVDAVLTDCGDALTRALIVDHSTVSPAGAKQRAERLRASGVSFLHAPLLMSPSMGRTASGLMLVSGPNAVFERAALGLQQMTQTLQYLGERTDLAAANQLFGSLMSIAVTTALAEVFLLAKNLGVSAPDAVELFDAFNPVGVLKCRGKAMARGEYDLQLELTMARKDVGLMLGHAADAQLTLLPAIAERMDELIARGLGAEDLSVLALDAVPKASPQRPDSGATPARRPVGGQPVPQYDRAGVAVKK